MSEEKIADTLQHLQDQVVENFMALIGEAKNELSDNDMKAIVLAAKDSAQLTIKAFTSGEDLSQEIKIVNAELANLAISKYFPVENLFWKAVERAGTMILSTLAKIAISAAVSAV